MVYRWEYIFDCHKEKDKLNWPSKETQKLFLSYKQKIRGRFIISHKIERQQITGAIKKAKSALFIDLNMGYNFTKYSESALYSP